MHKVTFRLYVALQTTYFSISFVSMDALSSAPMSNGANAINIWMLGCVVMVFAALCEYGVILFIKSRQRIPKATIGHTNSNSKRCGNPVRLNCHKTNSSGNINEENVGNAENRDARTTGCREVDRLSLIHI